MEQPCTDNKTEEEEFAAWMRESDEAQKRSELKAAKLLQSLRETREKVAELNRIVVQINNSYRELSEHGELASTK